MDQYSIEQAAGITDDSIAQYISDQKTPAARNAINLLKMLVDFYEPGGMGLLKCAVEECKQELANN